MTASVFPVLERLRDALGAVSGVRTARIGIEANMTADDYPMVRIVPQAIRNGQTGQTRQVEALVYFGQPIHEFTTTLEGEWQSLLAMEATLLQAAFGAPGMAVEYLDTITDDDRVDGYKLVALHLMVDG